MQSKFKLAQVALSLGLICGFAFESQVLAQGFSPNAGEDLLLPPEVIPLNAQAAQQMQQSQVQARQAQLGMGQMPMQPSAQQMRNDAFDQLMNKGDLPPSLTGEQKVGQLNPNMSSTGEICEDCVNHTNPTNTQSQTLSAGVKRNTASSKTMRNTGKPSAISRISTLAGGLGMAAIAMGAGYAISRSMNGGGGRYYGGYGGGGYYGGYGRGYGGYTNYNRGIMGMGLGSLGRRRFF